MALHTWRQLKRFIRHRWVDARHAQRVLSPAELAHLEALVQASEREHSGEIRICVEAGLPLSYLWRGAHSRERAWSLFGKLQVWNTEHNNGVLIYLLLADRRIEIIADRGLHRHVAPGHWASTTQALAQHIRAGQLAQGLEQAIHAAHRVLTLHFPQTASAANPNELPDRVILG
jgi:uncharacterized membrane protein